jgi:hypothetical protein
MLYNRDNLSLEHLAETKWISERAINFCRQNSLNSLSDLIYHHRKFRSFKNLDNCGNIINSELVGLFENFTNDSESEIFIKIKDRIEVRKLLEELSNEEIIIINNHLEYLLFNISVRARNGLLSLFNKTPEIIELIDKIYAPSFDLKSIRNIGEKTVLELQSFLELLIDYIKKYNPQTINFDSTLSVDEKSNNSIYETIISEFSPFKKAALYRHIEYLSSNLSVRAKNGLIQFFGEKSTSKELLNKIFSYSFSFQNLKNIGSKSVSELNSLKQEIALFIEVLRSSKDIELSKEYTKLIIKTTFREQLPNFNNQFEKIFTEEGKIQLFKLIGHLIETTRIFNHKEKELFFFLYTINYNKSLDQISKELELSKERIRQLRIILEKNITNFFQFILNFNSTDIVSYSISPETEFKIINDQFIQPINETEKVNFNTLFYSKIFGLFLENSHVTLGDDEAISGSGNYSNTIRYKSCYLIQINIFHSFHFESFVTDVSHNRTRRNTQSFSLHFEGYLMQFLSPNGKKNFDTIKSICESILYNEFDMIVNVSGYIVFEKNIRKPLTEYTYEILQELGKMTKIEDIVKLINERYPELFISEQSIRSTLQRDKEKYIFLGRSSTYGLKKWEVESETVKGGTIRNIVEEYLRKHSRPQHIYEIVNYVNQYRKTSKANIVNNIKAEETNRFIFFKNGFIGLKSIKYTSSDINYTKIGGSRFTKRCLKKFEGWLFDEVISFYVRKYNYTTAQVNFLLEAKINAGMIKLSDNKTIHL